MPKSVIVLTNRIPPPLSKQELLQKYLDGTCSSEELHLLYRYLQEDDANEYEALLATLWQQLSTTHTLSATTSDSIYEGVVLAAHGLASHKKSRRLFLPMAAAIVGILLVTGWLIRLWLFPAHVTYQTAYGEITQVTLPDSSVVDLNANSQLQIAATYATDPVREVWLTGEAYFHVTPKKVSITEGVKFIVHTSNLDVEVLGTTFNVKDRRGATDVVLNTGSVLLRNQADHTRALTMEPGDRVSLDQTQEFVLTRVAEPTAYASWKDHELYFDDQPLGAIQRELADTYNVRLRFGDPALAQLRFTGSAPSDDLTVLLGTVQKSFGLTLKKIDDGYLLTRKH